MTALVNALMLGWFPIMLAMFAVLGPGRAAIVGIFTGWLVLPVATLHIEGFIDIDKRAALSLGILLAAGLSDTQRLLRFKPSLVDLPMVLWCLSSYPTSVVNGLGLYDGFSTSLRLILRWGVPWFLGRLYLRDLRSQKLFCEVGFIAGLIYAPLCLWEVRMSPTLHGNVYGTLVYEGISYASSLGKWGSRPSVFMANPLELGLFMTTACLCGLALVLMRSRKRLFGFPYSILLAGLVLVSLVCKNLGASFLLFAGAASLWWAYRRKSLLPIYALSALMPLYAGLRATNSWDGTEIVDLASHIHAERAQSFAFRLHNEDLLVAKALQRPVFGWGEWGRGRVYDETGKDISVIDGMWEAAVVTFGLSGLVLLITSLLVPVAVLARRVERALLGDPRLVPAITATIVATLLAVDGIANDFPSPLSVLAAGGVACLPPLRAAAVRAGRGRTRSGTQALGPHAHA